jgi:hypothetical protein
MWRLYSFIATKEAMPTTLMLKRKEGWVETHAGGSAEVSV